VSYRQNVLFHLKKWRIYLVGATLLLFQLRFVAIGKPAEEHLADSIKTSLNASVTKNAPLDIEFSTSSEYIQYTRWLIATSGMLHRQMPNLQIRTDFLRTVWYESKRAGLDSSLVLGLIQVESGFKKYAVSSAGALGYMQIMPFWPKILGTGSPTQLFRMQTNVRFGCVILRHYLDTERGDLFMALGRYNGSRGKSEYPNAVLAAEKRWKAI
jgi:soluble lytic murein transglycosylase-like protein